jgi:hypothetical protein
MTDVSKTPEKKRIRRALVKAALGTLERHGWKVARVKGGGKGRLRRITKNGKHQLAAIRTTQDGWLAFPRTEDDASWVTLSEVDVVVASAVDDRANPKFALVHIFDAKELRDRFDRAYAARREADHKIPIGRGVWVSLYHEESTDPVNRVGAGIGLVHPPIARVSLDEADASDDGRPPVAPPRSPSDASDDDNFEPLTIPQAKVRLARTLGIPESSVKISIEA